MPHSVSKIVIVGDQIPNWLDNLDDDSFQVELKVLAENNFSFLSQQQCDLLMIYDHNPIFEIELLVEQINQSYPLVSIIILTMNTDPDHLLSYIEMGAQDVFTLTEDEKYLAKRFRLAVKHNRAKQTTINQNRNLNSVTVISRQLHNATDTNQLMSETLTIVTSTFQLMGLAIVLESGSQYHILASPINPSTQSIIDVMMPLHSYDPIRQCIEKGLVMVFDDFSANEFVVRIPTYRQYYSAIVVPLRYLNITLGAIVAFGSSDNPLTGHDVILYEHLGTHLGSAYQNVRHAHTQDISAKTNRHLLRTWQQLSSVYTSEEIGQTVVNLASDIVKIKHALVWLYHDLHNRPIVKASNSPSLRVFNKLYQRNIIDEYINQFDAQLRPLTIWLGRSSSYNLGDLFQVMEGQQLILVPIKDETRLSGCLLISVNSNEELSPEYVSVLEGIAHAAGQTLERNMLMTYQNQQKERLETVARSIKDGVFFVDEAQTVVFCNPQFTEFTGINPSNILNQPVSTLIDNIVQISDSSEQIREQLELAVQQMKNNSFDLDYPIVKLHITSLQSHVYIEFMALVTDQQDEQNGWLGVVSTQAQSRVEPEIDSLQPIMFSVVEHLQETARDIYRDSIGLSQGTFSPQQKNTVNQIKQQSQEIDQLLTNSQGLMRLSQKDALNFSLNDPNKMLSVILNKPPLLQYENRLDVRTKINDIKIRVDRRYMMQSLTNLIEVALSLSDHGIVQIQMGTQSNQFVCRVVSQRQAIAIDRINMILNNPQHDDSSIPYTTRLRLYFINQVVAHHKGKLVIKKSTTGMHFNILIPIELQGEVHTKPNLYRERTPELRLSSIMIYDTLLRPIDVNYEYLRANGNDLLYCDTLHQVATEAKMVRIHVIILAVRDSQETMISFVRRMRDQGITIPIMILSRDNKESIRIRALKAGVDVYSALPISDSELLAQVENLFERSKIPQRVHEPFDLGSLHIDFAMRQVMIDDERIDLTRIEYELLAQLALQAGQTLTHTELLTEIWGPEYRDEKQYLWVNMSRLRRKLEDTVDNKRYIFTQPGVGYILKES